MCYCIFDRNEQCTIGFFAEGQTDKKECSYTLHEKTEIKCNEWHPGTYEEMDEDPHPLSSSHWSNKFFPDEEEDTSSLIKRTEEKLRRLELEQARREREQREMEYRHRQTFRSSSPYTWQPSRRPWHDKDK